MPYTQENRSIVIDTPLGKNELLLTRFSGTEGISTLFNFEMEMLSENHEIAFEQIIGEVVTVSIILPDGDSRFFNGIISRFSQGSGGKSRGNNRFSYYTATMVPWFWLLTKTVDSRIFQQLSVP
ncbi:MAG: type VI secretion system tip protein VgrG, partial [Deltaproteobacteria bacterium]|nr:type VI secretion system tip protein VgrG [Deltaproteobacteria bacterium]